MTGGTDTLMFQIKQYFLTTPIDDIGAHFLIAFGWIPILWVVVWGLSQIWLDNKQNQYAGKYKWVLLAVNVPQDAVQTPKGMENFFSTLIGAKSTPTFKEKWMDGKIPAWYSFEIASVEGSIQFYIRCIEKYQNLLEASLYAQYPEAQIREVEDYTQSFPREYPDDEYEMFGAEVVLDKEGFMPIKTYVDFEHQGEKDQRFKDPLLAFLEGMGTMGPGEIYAVQVLIMPPLSTPWIKNGEKFINEAYGKKEKKKVSAFYQTIGWLPVEIFNSITGRQAAGEDGGQDDFAAFKITPLIKDAVDGVTRKISKIGYRTKIRWIYVAKKDNFRKGAVASMSKGLFSQYALLGQNKLGNYGKSIPNDDYFWLEWSYTKKQGILTNRFRKRSFGPGATPFYMNVEELATLWHFPAADARTPVLSKLGAKLSEAPTELEFAGLDEAVLQNADAPPSIVIETTQPNAARDGQLASAAPADQVSEPVDPFSAPRPAPPSPYGYSTPASESSAPVEQASESTMPAPEPISEEPPLDPVAAHDPTMPRPGRPAPPPPGLDLSTEYISEDGSPKNLPL